MTIFERALEFVSDGDCLGLGSGRAASGFIVALADRVRAGLRVRAVPTSRVSADLARRSGIPLVALDDALPLALTVDGADEIAPNLDLIKGYGRALLREKVVAVASNKVVILAGPEKEVSALGEHGKLPIEVLPFAVPLVRSRLAEMGLASTLDIRNDSPLVTDNGNYILDCQIGVQVDPRVMEAQIRSIPGVIETGLFLGVAQVVLVGDESQGFELLSERGRILV